MQLDLLIFSTKQNTDGVLYSCSLKLKSEFMTYEFAHSPSIMEIFLYPMQ